MPKIDFGSLTGAVARPVDAKENYGLVISSGDSYKLAEQAAFSKNRSLVISTFKANKITPIELKNPTAQEFSNEITSLAGKTNSSSVTYIYINAHGNNNGLSMLSKDGKKQHLSYTALKSKLDTIKGKKVLLLESCHSGSSITELEELAIVNSSLFNTSISEGDANSVSGKFRDKDYFILTACSANELSWYNSSGGYFTRKMCAAIGSPSSRLASKIDKKYVTLNEIRTHTSNHKYKGHLQIDYCYPEESNFPVFGNYLIRGNCTYYLVEVKVANVEGAGTDSNIYIRFLGNNISSDKYLLDHDNIDDFEKGRVYKYMVKCDKDIGDLSMITITSDNNDDYPEMLLEYIKVTDTGRNKCYKTISDMKSYWFDKQHASRSFSVKEIDHIYKLTVTIGDEDGAGTNSNVYVQLVGTNGNTTPYLLDSDIDDFERGTSLTYKVKADNDIGTLQSAVIISDNSGKTPEFHITHVVVEDTANNKRYSASESVWFRANNTRHTFNLSLKNNVAYLVNVKIADIGYAGTDANVYLQLTGVNGSSDFFLLDTPDKDDFEKNTYNLFNIHADNIGELKTVTIKHDNVGDGADMNVSYIEVLDKSKNKKYRATCNCWLDINHDTQGTFKLVAQ